MNDVTSLLRDLVALPSINPMGRPLQGPEIFETRVTDYLENYFRNLGVSFDRQKVAPGRENIVARSNLPGPRRTLLFEAHQDTVPVDNMTIDPFGATVKDGRLFGRGACDIKGGMTAMLTAFGRLAREKPSGAANIVIACTVDEEHTFLGVQWLMKQGIRADGAIVAEPTQLHIVNAHKGVSRWHLSTTGRSCHSSDPTQGVNAVYRMSQLLSAIEEYAESLGQSPGDPVLGPATLSVGRIEGGTSVNTVPDRCRIEIDRRLIPGEDPQAALKHFVSHLQKAVSWTDYPFECSNPWLTMPALSPQLSTDLVQQLGRAIDSVLGSHCVMPVPYGTDASTIAQYGIPAVVFGPGNIAQAHTKDEWVSLSEVEQASEILYQLACISGAP
jgi:acetylornithine deacetylase